MAGCVWRKSCPADGLAARPGKDGSTNNRQEIQMAHYDYLIIGGGMTAAAAAQGIREVDPSGSIAIFSAEKHQPYNRPPLTKKLWQGKPEDSIWRGLPQENLELQLGCRVTRIEPEQKQVEDDTGRTHTYGRLLLATGGSPRRLPFTPPETIYYRTLDDYHTVRRWAEEGARVGIIGGGFIGSEIAASLADNGAQPVMVFPEASLGVHIYPADLSEYVTSYYRQKGVDVHPGFTVQSIERSGDAFVLHSKDGGAIPVDHVLAGIGIRPNVDLAEAAGIATGGPDKGGGILVDEHLRTNQPDIYAAGDAASFYNPALGKTLRVEHEDNATSMGRAAGLNMAGRETAYDYLPFFYSDLFDLGYEAVGELNPAYETFADWKEPFRQGVIYYLKEGRVRGVLLWNTWDQVDAARQLIAEGKSFSPQDLKGRLPT